MKVDIEKLKQGLEQLTGVEHMAAEKEALGIELSA